MKILIVEDEIALQESINSYLKVEGYNCESALTFNEGQEKICMYPYDCLLIDVNLPDGNGLDLIKLAKSQNVTAGIIVISARETIDDRITGLNFGADDYIVKPFHLSELNARIYSLLRRIHFKGEDQIVFNEIEVNATERLVMINNSPLDLTKKEYDLLLYFLSNKNRVLTKESICEYLWGDHADNAGTLDFVYTHIKNLRKKMIDKGGQNYIHTMYGVGYKFTTK
ncbi:MAG: response regulator transcription factor [Bacteroidales bacterium]|nr:response regulator transcription factor [Bacteroidales bacterium]MCF8389873.1 response regulator transcription factor [Bacteroidales bacterium]